uniref:Uncharacterized protein n=1 Tax=Manihot esculenta TaxID=3983 RepID=A0A2C9U1J2_MANES
MRRDHPRSSRTSESPMQFLVTHLCWDISKKNACRAKSRR